MKAESRKSSTIFITLFVALGAIVVAYGWAMHFAFSDWNKSGVFGDSFGALNAAFTGIALIGIVVTIHQQQKQLEALKRDEMLGRSFLLLNEWQSEHVHAARSGVHGLTQGFVDVEALSTYEEQQKAYFRSDWEAKRNKAEQITQLFCVIYFLEKISLLLDAKMLDEEATKRIFKAPIEVYGKQLIRPLRANEHAENWIKLLDSIDENLLKRWGI